jgi:hypothetical protein
MQPYLKKLPALMTLAICGLLALHGPIPQLADYHRFADQATMLGIPHAANVLSNLGFAMVALWGLAILWPRRKHPAIAAGWPGYQLFLLGLLLTALGSSFYHLAPDNFRLVWDRLPIALACAGLLTAVRTETHDAMHGVRDAALLAVFAIASVAWWYASTQLGREDLRPYLLLQILPLILIPLWQTVYPTPAADRRMFALALLLYIAAKFAEVYDLALLSSLGWVSGHTLKHLLASAAAGILVWRLVQRVEYAIHSKQENAANAPLQSSAMAD